MAKQFHVYILASQRNGTLYIGVTSDLIKRVWQHKQAEIPGFTSKYNVKTLVYFQPAESAESAIMLEKKLKKLYRKDKLALIEENNPGWGDLYNLILDSQPAAENDVKA